MKKVFYLRKTVCIFLMLVILATALPAFSYGSTETQGSCGDNLTWKLEYRVLTISGKGAMKEYSFEDPSPWEGRYDIGKVVIEEGVTSISYCAFSMCSYMTSVSLPKSMKNIHEYAFTGCDGLREFSVHRENPYYKTVDNVLFTKDMSKLILYVGTASEYTIPQGTKILASGSFESYRFSTLRIPASVTTIEHGAFYGNNSVKDIYFGGTKKSWDKIYAEWNPDLDVTYNEKLYMHFDNDPDMNKVTSVEFTQRVYYVIRGEEVNLDVNIYPSDAPCKDVFFTSRNGACVLKNRGKLIAVEAGEAEIEVETYDGHKTATCKVIVQHEPDYDLAETVILPEQEGKVNKKTINHTGDYTQMHYRSGISNHSHIMKTNIFDVTKDSLSIIDGTNGYLSIEKYDHNYNLLSKKTIQYELPLYGGFYSTEKYNFAVFGQDNPNDDDNVEVIRIVKYDKDFNRLSSCSVKACATAYPFRSGSLRMDFDGKTLAIHTARKHYKSTGEIIPVNHQGQLSLLMDVDTMKIKNILTTFQENHVSHSFNQFVQYDGEDLYFLDHGDAYPRSIITFKRSKGIYTPRELYSLRGESGDNYTGVSLGGFSVDKNNMLVAFNSINYAEKEKFEYADGETRDILLLSAEKNGTKITTRRYTDYSRENKVASFPYLVKVRDGMYLLMWEEFLYKYSEIWENDVGYTQGIKYVLVNEHGENLSKVFYDKDAYLSEQCQPVIKGNKVFWFTNGENNRSTFYSLSLENILPKANVTTKKENGKITVSLEYAPANSIVFLALYKEKALVSIKKQDYVGENVVFDISENYDNAVVYVWESINSLRPVCAPEIVK